MSTPTAILDARWLRGVESDGYPLIEYYDADKRRHIVRANIHPYFFIRKSHLSKAKEVLLKLMDKIVNIERGPYVNSRWDPLVKIEVTFPSDVRVGIQSCWIQSHRWEWPVHKSE